MDGAEQIYKDLGSRVDWEDNEFHNHYDKQPKPDYGPTRYARGPCGRVCVTAVANVLGLRARGCTRVFFQRELQHMTWF